MSLQHTEEYASFPLDTSPGVGGVFVLSCSFPGVLGVFLTHVVGHIKVDAPGIGS